MGLLPIQSIGSRSQLSLDAPKVAKRDEPVRRPLKNSEFEIRFATNHAEKGWRDLVATYRNAMVDTHDFLTKTPTAFDAKTNYKLKGDLAEVTGPDGKKYERWQHKPTATGDGRVWFFVVNSVVYLEKVYTKHPSQTK